jgi:hypothetical protein
MSADHHERVVVGAVSLIAGAFAALGSGLRERALAMLIR